MSWTSGYRGPGEAIAGRVDARQMHMWGHGRMKPDVSTKTQGEQTWVTDTTDGRMDGRTDGQSQADERGWMAVESALGAGWAGRLAPKVAGTPTYGLQCASVVVALAAAALELRLQPGQSLQLPLDGVRSWGLRGTERKRLRRQMF